MAAAGFTTHSMQVMHCDVPGTQGSGIPAGIGADSRKFRLWTGIPGIRDSGNPGLPAVVPLKG